MNQNLTDQKCSTLVDYTKLLKCEVEFMPKSPDKSETVRIKSSFAEFIREESKRLNLNFLETLYYIINVYRYEISQKSVLRTVELKQTQQQATLHTQEEEVKPKGENEPQNVNNTPTTDNDDDFYANCK